MAEWLVEEGIAEHRAILVEGGQILAARVDWLDPVRPGMIAEARLVAKAAGARRGTARLADGSDVLVDDLPREITEGATLRLRITRGRIAERGRCKLPQARPAPVGAELAEGPTLATALRGQQAVRLCRPGDGRFEAAGWSELVEEALEGTVAFVGGSLLVCPTPAMTVIDIDGPLPPRALALAAVAPLASALRRLDIGGPVGIDFPTLADRKDRQAVDIALADALVGWPGERTAMNGFGFVQLVSRLERPSLPALYQRFPGRVAASTIERLALAHQGGGELVLHANPALRQALPASFAPELERRLGRGWRWHWDEALALQSPFVQSITP